jgi:hypothetical protein
MGLGPLWLLALQLPSNSISRKMASKLWQSSWKGQRRPPKLKPLWTIRPRQISHQLLAEAVSEASLGSLTTPHWTNICQWTTIEISAWAMPSPRILLSRCIWVQSKKRERQLPIISYGLIRPSLQRMVASKSSRLIKRRRTWTWQETPMKRM